MSCAVSFPVRHFSPVKDTDVDDSYVRKFPDLMDG